MAHFFGSIHGNHFETTRTGTRVSGLGVYAASWEGRVSVRLTYDEKTGHDLAHVELDQHQGNGVHRVLYAGPVGSYEPSHAAELRWARDALAKLDIASLPAERDRAQCAAANALRTLVDALSDPLVGPEEGEGSDDEPAWEDCKVAFGVEDDDAAEKLSNSKRLPAGWELNDIDCTGARCVAIFRVSGVPRKEDGDAVLALLVEVGAITAE